MSFLLSFYCRSRVHTHDEREIGEFRDERRAAFRHTHDEREIDLVPGPKGFVCRVREPETGKTIAVERVELRKEDFDGARRRLMTQRRFAKSGWYRLNPQEVAALFEETLRLQLVEGQLPTVSADERVLLLRCQMPGTTESNFLRAPIEVWPHPRISHCYLIVRGRLLECW